MTTSTQVEREKFLISDPPDKCPAALIDLDGTFYDGLIMEELVEVQERDGLLAKAAIPGILAVIHDYKDGQKGTNANITDLHSHWAAGLAGQYYSDLLYHTKDFIQANEDRFYPFVRPVLKKLKMEEYDRRLITGEPSFVAEAVENLYDMTGYCASEWELDSEKHFTGRITRLMTSQQKEICAEQELSKNKNKRSRSFALIDSVGDIGLANTVPFIVVIGTGSPKLMDHLSRSGKTFVLASPENTFRYVDLWTRL